MSISRDEFENAMGLEWQTAYPIVEAMAKFILGHMVPGAERISTAQLAESIYPTTGAFMCDVRKRVFKALEACASRGLAPYVELGPLEQIGLTNGRRKLWGPPQTTPGARYTVCGACGQKLP